MTVLSTSNLTLADWAKRIEPDDGRVAKVAELLSQTNEILDDCVFKEGNLPTGHRHTIRTGLPTVYWRAINQGIPPSKSTTAQVDEAVGHLESRSEPDVLLANLNAQRDSFRLSEDKAFIEAMGQEMAQTIIYGNPALEPKEFLGLAPRYGAISGAGNAQNVISGAGAGNCTSIWLVQWSDDTCFCIFPKGSKIGLDHRNLGEQTVWNADGTRYQALVSLFTWTNGLAVKDWRSVVRIPNVEVADIAGLSNEQAPTVFTNIIHKMAQAYYRIPNPGMGRMAWYMNRTVHSGLMRLGFEKSANVLAVNEGLSQFGTPRRYTSFLGVPIRLTDALLNTEAVVT